MTDRISSAAKPVADEVITSPAWQDLTEVVSGTDVRVSTLDRLDEISPEMFRWWFCHMDAESYQQFHPHDHANFSWVRGKVPEEYVGATHRTHHQYGGSGPVLRSEITFLPPRQMFSDRALDRLGVGHALAAVAHGLDESDRPQGSASGHFVHVVIPDGTGSQLRSKWWLTVGPETDLDLVTVGRTRHVHEEFAYLGGFLPELYASREDVGERGQS